jgi:hypothetical protein
MEQNLNRLKHALALSVLICLPAFAQQTPFFKPGNLVVVVSGCGVNQGTCTSVPNGMGTGTLNSSAGGYGDNQASPLTLFQFTTNGTFLNSLVLPQSASGANLPVSAEYGSSSEGTLQLSAGGQFLTVMGYGIDAPTFDAAYPPGFTMDPYGAAPSGALAQSGSLTGQTYMAVPRIVALIDASGNVNSSTALFNIFNAQNPRSIYTLDGFNAWVSGQGNDDATGGVFYVPLFGTTTAPTPITGLDTTTAATNGTPFGQDTRDVQVVNNTLYVSVDSKEGKGFNRSFIGTLGTPPAKSLFNNAAGPTELNGFGNSGGTGKVSITSGGSSNGNNLNTGLAINLSPVNFFFASASVLYVADSGNPKNDSNGDNDSSGATNIGDGGLQKWVNSKSDGSGSWSLKYTLYQGIGGPGQGVVNNGATSGISGLYGLAGVVNGATVQLFATSNTLNDLDQTYLYTITDTLSNTTPPGSSVVFTILAAAPSDSNFKGVSLTPSIPNGDVEITSTPSGLAFTSSGTGCAPGTYTTPQTLTWTPNSSCTLGVVSPQTAQGLQYAFSQWEDGTTSTTHIVTAPTTTAAFNAGFKIVPPITWPAPASIAFGSALSSEQLNATANIAGTFVYTPPAGTVLPVGNNQTLSVTFTPTDTTSYTMAIAINSISVTAASGPATLVLTDTLARDPSTGNLLVTVNLANTGGSAATGVEVTSATIGATSPLTTLPAALADVPAGGSSSVVLTFPASVGSSGARAVLSVKGTYSGGSFGGSSRVTLP